MVRYKVEGGARIKVSCGLVKVSFFKVRFIGLVKVKVGRRGYYYLGIEINMYKNNIINNR